MTGQERIAALAQFSSDALLTEWLRRQEDDILILLEPLLVDDLPLPRNGQQS
jgi:hypothetical protein